ncbi:hypothetical protein Rhopal_003994-T1 [Rhodotorula paludigena]|uniref:Sugar phosphate transporter domain-containing protein n=1 Tax=Rhodotorula paludigena TaxID=86838 RepID=A0AAV5GEM4_9BASI|nr:hypothetical protein Rhopal_003994-T1 [Rhodotorula paludigena]
MDVGTLAGTATLPAACSSSSSQQQHRRAPSLVARDLPNSLRSAAAPPDLARRSPNPDTTRIRVSPASSAPSSRSSSPVLRGTITRRHPPSPNPAGTPLKHAHLPLLRRASLTLHEYVTAAARPATYVSFVRSLHPALLALFLVSVSATLSNKTLLRGFFHGLTYSLTSWQMSCATLGTMLAQRLGVYRPQRVPIKHNSLLQAIAVVFSCEILCSNMALRLVPVPFHVSLRAAAPILTLLLSVSFFRQRTTLRTASALLGVLLGVAFTSHHEQYLSLGSLFLIGSTLLLTAKSLLVTHILESRLSLHPLDVLARMSPLSSLHCALFAIVNGEPRRLWRFVRGNEFTRAHLAEVALNGVLSFAVVVLGLVADKKTRPPALAITTHAAQATTILASLLLFGLRLSPLNFVGVALTLGGGVLYATWDARDQDRAALGLGLGGGGAAGGGGEEVLPLRGPVLAGAAKKRAPD